MKTLYSHTKSCPELLSDFTGLSVTEFETVLSKFAAQYEELITKPHVERLRQKGSRACGNNHCGRIPEVADKLFFILTYNRLRCSPTAQGLLFGMTPGRARAYINALMPVLSSILDKHLIIFE